MNKPKWKIRKSAVFDLPPITTFEPRNFEAGVISAYLIMHGYCKSFGNVIYKWS